MGQGTNARGQMSVAILRIHTIRSPTNSSGATRRHRRAASTGACQRAVPRGVWSTTTTAKRSSTQLARRAPADLPACAVLKGLRQADPQVSTPVGRLPGGTALYSPHPTRGAKVSTWSRLRRTEPAGAVSAHAGHDRWRLRPPGAEGGPPRCSPATARTGRRLPPPQPAPRNPGLSAPGRSPPTPSVVGMDTQRSARPLRPRIRQRE